MTVLSRGRPGSREPRSESNETSDHAIYGFYREHTLRPRNLAAQLPASHADANVCSVSSVFKCLRDNISLLRFPAVNFQSERVKINHVKAKSMTLLHAFRFNSLHKIVEQKQ